MWWPFCLLTGLLYQDCSLAISSLLLAEWDESEREEKRTRIQKGRTKEINQMFATALKMERKRMAKPLNFRFYFSTLVIFQNEPNEKFIIFYIMHITNSVQIKDDLFFILWIRAIVSMQ